MRGIMSAQRTSRHKNHFTLPCYARCTCSGRSILTQLNICLGEDLLNVDDLQAKLKPLFVKLFGVRRHPFKVHAALNLKGQDAAVFQDILDLSLAEGYSDVSHSVPCKRLMKKIAKHSGKLPRLFFLQPEQIYNVKRHPSRTRNARFYTGIFNGHLVMLKSLNLPSDNEDPKLHVDLYRETVIWRHLRHDNVLPFLGVCVMESDWRLVAPYMPNGDLRKYLGNERNRIGEEGLLLLIQQIVEGVSFLHSNGIIHADIKPENIFIDQNKRAVVGDIGLAFLCDESYEPTRTASASRVIATGTVRYMAPELLDDKYHRSTTRTDIYALGMTIFNILTRQKPFQGIDENSVQKEVLRRKRPKRVHVSRYGGPIHRDAWELISRCWEHHPSKRSSMSEVRERVNILLRLPKEDKPKRWRSFFGFFSRSSSESSDFVDQPEAYSEVARAFIPRERFTRPVSTEKRTRRKEGRKDVFKVYPHARTSRILPVDRPTRADPYVPTIPSGNRSGGAPYDDSDDESYGPDPITWANTQFNARVAN